MFLRKLLPALALTFALAAPSPAFAADEITLTPAEVEAIKLRLAIAKPNVSTVTIIGFLAPGSAQAYMGHMDRSLLIWGGYLLGFAVLKAALPSSPASPGGPSVNDLAVSSLFLGVAAGSAIDAYFLALGQRAEYDKVIGTLSEKQPLKP